MEYNELRLTGELQEGINGRKIVLCKEFPISGAGDTTEEAIQSLLRSFRIYKKANLQALTKPNIRSVKRPVQTFAFEMPYSSEESEREAMAFA